MKTFLSTFILFVALFGCTSKTIKYNSILSNYSVWTSSSTRFECKSNIACIGNFNDWNSEIISLWSDSICIRCENELKDSSISFTKKLNQNDKTIMDTIQNIILNLNSELQGNPNVSDCSVTILYLNSKQMRCECCKDPRIKKVNDYIKQLLDLEIIRDKAENSIKKFNFKKR